MPVSKKGFASDVLAFFWRCLCALLKMSSPSHSILFFREQVNSMYTEHFPHDCCVLLVLRMLLFLDVLPSGASILCT
jgi:hypothetical protein